MPKSITKLEALFDADAILKCMPSEIYSVEFVTDGQLSLTHKDGNPSWFDSSGSLYDAKLKIYTRKTSDFIVLNDFFTGTYVEEVINEIKRIAISDGVKTGRIRIMQLKPKTCYSYHLDPEEFRYHIPLMTNDKCFFVNDMKIEQMPEVGRLYKFQTHDYHTAVNASFENRLHLLVDTFT
jgi:hypothetical protein